MSPTSSGQKLQEQHLLCFKLLRSLAQRESDSCRNRYSDEVLALRSELINRFPPMSVEELEREVSPKTGTNGELAPKKKFVYFEASSIGGWFIPVATVAFDFGDEPCTLRLRIGLFGAKGERAGYRFETPEGKTGAHSYYHAQPIRGWTSDDTDITSEGINCRQPAFPIDANSPVTLVLASVLACYGAGYLRDLIAHDQFQRLPPHLADLNWYKSLRAT